MINHQISIAGRFPGPLFWHFQVEMSSGNLMLAPFMFTAGRSGFGSLLSLHSVGKTDRIYMKGPGGRGEVEVAVSGVVGKLKNGCYLIMLYHKIWSLFVRLCCLISFYKAGDLVYYLKCNLLYLLNFLQLIQKLERASNLYRESI